MTLRQADIDYFNRGRAENPRYWSRFGGRPDFTHATVSDLGCGHGSLCIDLALAGAKRVIGFDLDAHRIDFANEYLRCNYPQLASVVEFRQQDVCEAPEFDLDYFVSKDTFEHIQDLGRVLEAMRTRLRPGGRVYAGFGPLWNSPFGDHHRTRANLPWGHIAFSESYLIGRLNRLRRGESEKVTSIYALGLNKLSLADYQRLFRRSGMRIVFFRVNASAHPVSRMFSLLRELPGMREYFSHNLYCILEKPPQ